MRQSFEVVDNPDPAMPSFTRFGTRFLSFIFQFFPALFFGTTGDLFGPPPLITGSFLVEAKVEFS